MNKGKWGKVGIFQSVSNAQNEQKCDIIALMKDFEKENIKIMSSFNKRLILAFSFAFILSAVASAKEFVVPPMSASSYADTEVTTNIAINTQRFDVKEFALNIFFEAASSNNIQVAFGCDEDENGILSFSETDAVYGYRNGRCVIEDVKNAVRYEEVVADGRANFNIRMRMRKDYAPKEFSTSVGTSQIFTDFSSDVHSWLYQPKWNLMRVTRRGAGAPVEWLSCDIKYSHFYLSKNNTLICNDFGIIIFLLRNKDGIFKKILVFSDFRLFCSYRSCCLARWVESGRRLVSLCGKSCFRRQDAVSGLFLHPRTSSSRCLFAV